MNTALLDEMQRMQDTLYEQDGGKNTFFKKSQKTEIARTISQNFELERLLNDTIFIISGTNEIYMDYPHLKMFIHPDIYDSIIEHIFKLYDICITQYGGYHVNINLSGFTVSAAERHKNLIISFANRCTGLLQTGTDYSAYTIIMRVLNIPTSIEMIVRMFKPFCSPIVRERVTLLSKSESEPIMRNFFGTM